eukprot:4108602-Pyramimonas_sp.AAC.1
MASPRAQIFPAPRRGSSWNARGTKPSLSACHPRPAWRQSISQTSCGADSDEHTLLFGALLAQSTPVDHLLRLLRVVAP